MLCWSLDKSKIFFIFYFFYLQWEQPFATLFLLIYNLVFADYLNVYTKDGPTGICPRNREKWFFRRHFDSKPWADRDGEQLVLDVCAADNLFTAFSALFFFPTQFHRKLWFSLRRNGWKWENSSLRKQNTLLRLRTSLLPVSIFRFQSSVLIREA